MARARWTWGLPLAAALSLGGAVDAQERPPLVVAVTRPTSGLLDTGFAATVEGTVSDRGVRSAWLTANGLSREVPVTDGRVRAYVLALPGTNRVTLTATREGATARDAVTFHARGPRAELVVWAAWPAGHEGLRLQVTDPELGACRARHRCDLDWRDCPCVPHGGVLADPTGDAPTRSRRATSRAADPSNAGFSWYAVRSVRAGSYALHATPVSVEVARWRAAFSLGELLDRLDTDGPSLAPARRAALLEELDRAAAPLASTVPVQAVAVLFPGTPQERRLRFDGAVNRSVSTALLGVVAVTEAELRAVRGAP